MYIERGGNVCISNGGGSIERRGDAEMGWVLGFDGGWWLVVVCYGGKVTVVDQC